MKFVKTSTSQPVIDHTRRAINEALQNDSRVLWLLSGGSSIDIAVKVRNGLSTAQGLTVMQVDERFGPVGHADSNWQKLLEAGFDTNGVDCWPVLQGNASPEQTAADYEEVLHKAFEDTDFCLGLFGIGADGHTAGILPGSSAVSSKKLVASYKGPDFERITMTAPAIAKVDLAVVHAVGADKRQALQSLQKDLRPDQQPAQFLKQAREVYVYNDSMGTEGL